MNTSARTAKVVHSHRFFPALTVVYTIVIGALVIAALYLDLPARKPAPPLIVADKQCAKVLSELLMQLPVPPAPPETSSGANPLERGA